MRSAGQRRKSLLIGILLVMVCVQSFSMHFHLADADNDHKSHAHAHIYGSVETDHLTTEHEDEINTETLAILNKPWLSFDLFFLLVITQFAVSLSKESGRSAAAKKRPRYRLLFFRPPLRAPPV